MAPLEETKLSDTILEMARLNHMALSYWRNIDDNYQLVN